MSRIPSKSFCFWNFLYRALSRYFCLKKSRAFKKKCFCQRYHSNHEALVCLWTLCSVSVLVELLLWCAMASDVSISIYEVDWWSEVFRYLPRDEYRVVSLASLFSFSDAHHLWQRLRQREWGWPEVLSSISYEGWPERKIIMKTSVSILLNLKDWKVVTKIKVEGHHAPWGAPWQPDRARTGRGREGRCRAQNRWGVSGRRESPSRWEGQTGRWAGGPSRSSIWQARKKPKNSHKVVNKYYCLTKQLVR